MGVNHLWGILAPVKIHKPLKSLEGQTIVVDLSVWICESAHALEGLPVAKPYLRNLFFRISNLIQMGVHLIFVLDGEPPELKWEEMARRNEARFDGSRKGRWGHRRRKKEQTGRQGASVGEGLGRIKKKDRKRFNFVLKECQEMLQHLGIPCLQAAGEAEAMCAYLNQQGIADACLTEDGDVFLYGARTVYKNFTLNAKDPHIECYSMERIESQLGLDQHKLIALALLLGCDYVSGVPGIGPKQALRHLREAHTGLDVLKRFRDQADGRIPSDWTRQAPKKTPHCSRCSHAGSGREHRVYGCSMCETDTACHPKTAQTPKCSCPWHASAETRQKTSLEQEIMRRACVIPGFPSQPMIDEFLIVKDKCPTKKLIWKRPQLIGSQKFISAKLEWPDDYTVEKIFPLVTLWDLTAISSDRSLDPALHVRPIAVVKKRVRQGVASVEVKWQTGIPHSELEHPVTIEREDLFTKAFPEMMTAFEQEKAAKTKHRKKKVYATRKESTDESDSVNPPCSNVCDIDNLASAVAELSLISQPNRSSEERKPEVSSVEHSGPPKNTMKSEAAGCCGLSRTDWEAKNLTTDFSYIGQISRDVSSLSGTFCDSTDVEPLPLSERLKLKKSHDSFPLSSSWERRNVRVNLEVKEDVEFVCSDDSLSSCMSLEDGTLYKLVNTTPPLKEYENEMEPESISFSSHKESVPVLQSVDVSPTDSSKNATFGLGFELTNLLSHDNSQDTTDENATLLHLQDPEELVSLSVTSSPASSAENCTFGIGFELTKFLSHDDSQEPDEQNTSLDQSHIKEQSANPSFIPQSQPVKSQQKPRNLGMVPAGLEHQNVHNGDGNCWREGHGYLSDVAETVGEESVQISDLTTSSTSEDRILACGSFHDGLKQVLEEDDFEEENRQPTGGLGHCSPKNDANLGSFSSQKDTKTLLYDSKDIIERELTRGRFRETINFDKLDRSYSHRTPNPMNKVGASLHTPVNSLSCMFTPLPIDVDTPVMTDDSPFVASHLKSSTLHMSNQPTTSPDSNILTRSRSSSRLGITLLNKHASSENKEDLDDQLETFTQENSPISLLDRLKRRHGNQNGVLSAALSMKTSSSLGDKQKRGRKVLVEIFDDDNENDSFP